MTEVRMVGLSERTWARGRQYQNFLGKYIRRGDLWFDWETSDADVRHVLAVYANVSQALRQLAVKYKLTVSCAKGRALNGSMSAIYGNWAAVSPEAVSPHLELGAESRANDVLLLAHLTHELSHLLFEDMSSYARRQFIASLHESVHPDLVEVTPYAGDCMKVHFNGHCCGNQVDEMKGRCLWGREAFAETIACWCVPEYPSRNTQTTVSLAERIQLIETLSGISLTV